MFITKKAMPRRTFLKGAQAALALPLLDAMIPAATAWAKTPAKPVPRLGFVFIPLQVVAFASLPVELRTEGTALFSLMRNVGSAVGISITSFLLAQNTQIMHADLVAHVTPFNRMLQTGGAYLFWNVTRPRGLSALNDEITRQAQIIAYADDFKFMLMITLPTILLLLLMRRPRTGPQAPAPEQAVID